MSKHGIIQITYLLTIGFCAGIWIDFVARINSKHLSEHRGEIVRLIAKVATLSGDTATLETSDGGTVSLAR